MTRGLQVVTLLLAGPLGLSCAFPMGGAGYVRDIQPGERPAVETSEAGIWMQVGELEEEISRSGMRARDDRLTAYVNDVACKVAADYCADIRVYLLDVPYFNATMFPNGMMNVWTGMLLRMRNEAQLAAVLAHEIGHYVKRHSLKRTMDTIAKANLLMAFSLMAAAVQRGELMPLAQLATVASLAAYSREQEREADQISVQLMWRSGYTTDQAAELWEYVVAESEAEDASEPLMFLASHPASNERIETLRLASGELEARDGASDDAERFLRAIRPHRAPWLEAELRLRKFERTTALLEHLSDRSKGDAELAFFHGELHRARNQDNDVEEAIRWYRTAIASEPTYAPPYRELGLLLRKTGNTEESVANLRRFLELDPGADDRAMLEHYIQHR